MNDINELKVRAYDTVAQIQFLQNQLAGINVEISRLSQPPPVSPDAK